MTKANTTMVKLHKSLNSTVMKIVSVCYDTGENLRSKHESYLGSNEHDQKEKRATVIGKTVDTIMRVRLRYFFGSNEHDQKESDHYRKDSGHYNAC